MIRRANIMTERKTSPQRKQGMFRPCLRCGPAWSVRMRHFLIFASLVIIAGCTSKPPAKVESTSKIDTPKKKPMRRLIEQPATIEPFQEAPLVAQISGYVEKVHVDIEKPVAGPKD